MNNKRLVLTLALIALVVGCAFWLYAAESTPISRCEYITIRWAGRENTHIIRPGGQVEFVSSELRKASKPDRADDRAFYMNLVMNGLTKDGYEFAGMSSDEIVMKRQVPK
jgi:hypothetical protein